MAWAIAIAEQPALGEARGVLRDAFGVRFDLWQQAETGWRFVADESSSGEDSFQFATFPPAAVSSLLDRVDDERPRCRVAGNSLWIAVPVSPSVVATARLPAGPRKLLMRMARLVQRRLQERRELAALRRDQHSFLVQVTSDLESLTFLMGATSLLDLSGQSLSLETMARKLLRTLRPVLRSETLAMVLVRNADLGVPLAEERFPAVVSCFDGPEDVSLETCLRIVERFRYDCVHHPLVVNSLTRYEPDERFPNVQGFVLVPILRRDETVGWLLALNRAMPDHISPLHGGPADSRVDFGAHEANLLNSAASILGTHASNIELIRQRDAWHVSVVRDLVSAMDAKDEYARGHGERVGQIARRLVVELGLAPDTCAPLELTGLLQAHAAGDISPTTTAPPPGDPASVSHAGS